MDHLIGRSAAIRRPSRVEQANGGTLLLSGASELSPPLQDALSHFLASREFPRLGSTQAPSQVDVRLIATSHDTLFEDVAFGRFRDDLLVTTSVRHVVESETLPREVLGVSPRLGGLRDESSGRLSTDRITPC